MIVRETTSPAAFAAKSLKDKVIWSTDVIDGTIAGDPPRPTGVMILCPTGEASPHCGYPEHGDRVQLGARKSPEVGLSIPVGHGDEWPKAMPWGLLSQLPAPPLVFNDFQHPRGPRRTGGVWRSLGNHLEKLVHLWTLAGVTPEFFRRNFEVDRHQCTRPRESLAARSSKRPWLAFFPVKR